MESSVSTPGTSLYSAIFQLKKIFPLSTNILTYHGGQCEPLSPVDLKNSMSTASNLFHAANYQQLTSLNYQSYHVIV